MTFLQLSNVDLSFAANSKPVLHAINVEVQQGDFMILLGSNGSGKSSLLKLLHRDYQPTRGHIQFLNKPLMAYANKVFSQQVAVLTQNYADSLFVSLSVWENYLLINRETVFLGLHAAKKRQFLADYLREFNPNLPNKLDLIVNQLSGGEKQALALALCFLHPPTLLLLDEHTSALDPKTSEQIMRLTQRMIVKHHITCLLTTHDLDLATRYGNRILVLREGEVHSLVNQAEKSQLTKEHLMANFY
jgi:putative ABC transport system ATP-binding protein